MLFKQMVALQPKTIVIDSEFSMAKSSLVELWKEPTHPADATIAAVAGQTYSIVGRMSRLAMETLASAYNYNVEWCDWALDNTESCADYVEGRRTTCILTRDS